MDGQESWANGKGTFEWFSYVEWPTNCQRHVVR